MSFRMWHYALLSTFCATMMSWLEWVASNAYEGGVIEFDGIHSSNFRKVECFWLFC